MKFFLTTLITFYCAIICYGQNNNEFNCFSIVAGKNATADGSVLVAHNEDDSGEQMLNVYITKSEPQNNIAKYLWVEFPGMKVADSFLNEYGVAITSDNCPSKEDKPELTNGGVLYELRVNAAKYAHSAKEAVKIMGALIDKYGYNGSGRSYMLADSNEGWILSAVNGKHWVAARIPDDHVMIIPNNYVIDKVNLADTANYAGSPDIIEYAIKRGWYNPQKDGEFSFKKAYGNPSKYTSNRNVIRHLSAIQYFTGNKYNANPDTFEFSVKPKSKVTLQDMINVLSSHGENTIFADSIANASKERHPLCICVNTTVMSAIFQLRGNMPKEIGSVMWLAHHHPCATAYIPWYLGMTSQPQGFARFNSYKEAIDKHFTDTKDKRKNYPDAICWKFIDRFEQIDGNYHNNIKPVSILNKKFQKKLFKGQRKFEKSLKKFDINSTNFKNELNSYTKEIYDNYFNFILK